MGGGTASAGAVECGLGFVRDYYKKFASAPDELVSMYSDASIWCHHASSEAPDPVVGRPAIAASLDAISQKGVQRKYAIDTLEAHPTVSDSVLILVRGQCLMRSMCENFVHTFIVARAEQGTYYIHNDCMESTPTPDPTAADEWSAEPARQEVQEQQVPAPARQRSPPRGPPPAAARGASPAKERSSTPPRGPAAPAAAPPAARRPSPERPREPGGMSWAGLVREQPQAPPPHAAPQVQRVAGGKVPTQGQAAKKPEDEKAAVKPAADGWEQVRGRRAPSPQRPARAPSPGRDGRPARGASPERRPGDARARSPERGGGGTGRYAHAALYVSRVPDDMRESDIEAIFGTYGRIVGKTFRPGQYCFVDFDDPAAVRKALQANDEGGVFHGSKQLSVQERKSPEERARERAEGRFGGGGGRGY